MKPFSVALFFIFLYSAHIQAQDAWTLEQCLEYAAENNLSLKQNKIGISSSEIDLEQSRSNRLPSLNGNASHVYNFGRSNDPTTNDFIEQRIRTNNFGLQGSVDVFRGFNLKHSIERDQLSLSSSQLQYEVAKNDLTLTIVGAYLNIMRNRDQIEVLKEQSKITLDQKERVERLIEVGSLPAGDVLELEAQVANNEVSIVQAENALEMSRLNLAQVLDYYESLDVADPSIEVPSSALIESMSVEEIYNKALTVLPQIKAAALGEQIADKNLEISKTFRYPTLSFFAGLGSNYAGVEIPSAFELGGFGEVPIGYVGTDFTQPVYTTEINITETTMQPFFDQLSNNFSYNAGLTLSVPIFNKNQVKNGMKRARLGQESAKLQSDLAKNQLYQTIQQAYQDARSAAKIYEANLKTIESLELAFNNTEKRYELGVANALEFSTARNNLAIAQLNLNSARYNYLFLMKILDFYQGKELKL